VNKRNLCLWLDSEKALRSHLALSHHSCVILIPLDQHQQQYTYFSNVSGMCSHSKYISASRCRKFMDLLFPLLLLLLFRGTAAQSSPASSCSACVASNPASIYVDSSDLTLSNMGGYTFSTGIGGPSVVWCSSDPTGDGGTCAPTTFIVANLQMQCGGWANTSHSFANPTQASPCPAAAPYAFFQSCDCTRTCKYQGLAFDGFGRRIGYGVTVSRSFVYLANVFNLLRSCDLCIAGGGEWWSASDLSSAACSNVTIVRDEDCCRSPGWQQTVVPSCHAPGQRFLSATKQDNHDDGRVIYNDYSVRDVNIFEPAFRYTTSYQCRHGSSFCAIINLSGVNCVVMIALLVNVPVAFLYMRLSTIALRTNQSIDKRTEVCYQTISATLFLFGFIHETFTSCSATTPLARRRNFFTEFVVTYIFWPVALSVAFLPPAIVFACLVSYFLFWYIAVKTCQSCWAFCGGEKSSAPDVEMRIATQQPIEAGNDNRQGGEQAVAEEAAGSDPDTVTSNVRVDMQDDELSPLIYRHVEASTRELRCQLQEVDVRSRRIEALLNELIGRSSMNPAPQ
jgi:hypothetical protein